MRHDIVVEELDQLPAWKLPEPAPMRTSGPLIQMDSVTFAYPPASRDGATGMLADLYNCQSIIHIM